MPPNEKSDAFSGIREILEIIARLRGEGGCPWDRKQTPESAQVYLVEEAHEAAAAVREGEAAEVRDELGDLLFMVLFMTRLYEERGAFTLSDVASRIAEKMVRRHPHVFAGVVAETPEAVRANWEEIKAREKAQDGARGSEVPATLPALVRAYRVLSRRAHHEPALDDAKGEAAGLLGLAREISGRVAAGEAVSGEVFGVALLSLANLARICKLRPEDALHDALRNPAAKEGAPRGNP